MNAEALAVTDPRIRIPSIDRLIASAALESVCLEHGRPIVVQALREVTAEARTRATAGIPAPDEDALAGEAGRRVRQWMRQGPRRVFNLTGTVLHTNLGRAPLSDAALAAMTCAAGACDLEFDLDAGKRGERDWRAEQWLARLTGAEGAVVVNNNAAAVLLVLNTFAVGKDVAVSRGELVEIGGSFRMPEIMRRAGARLREIGTTNRTHLRDYEDSVGPRTAMLMKVSTSNYEIQGFTATVADADVAAVAHRHDLVMYSELGSGALVDLRQFGLPYEPTPQDALAAGADLVSFSGDKLLGGPQAGIILGRRDLISRIRRNPLLRALRLDKMRLAALGAVLRTYADQATARDTLPALRLLSRPVKAISAAAERLQPFVQRALANDGVSVQTVSCESQVGSGAHPLTRLPSAGLRLAPSGTPRRASPAAIARRLRALDVPVIGRIEKDAVVLDLRCLEPVDHDLFLRQLAQLNPEEKQLR